jgi:hypothetical protein
VPVLREVQEEAAAAGGHGRGAGTGVMVGFDLMGVNLARLARLPRLLGPLADMAAAMLWTVPDPEDA